MFSTGGGVWRELSPLNKGLVTIVVTLAAATAGLQQQADGIALFWPAAGVITGLLVRAESREWGYVIGGALVALALGNASQGRSVAASAVFMSGNIVQAASIAFIIGLVARHGSRGAVVTSAFVGATVVAAAVVGLAEAAGLRWTGHAQGDFIEVWQGWFVSQTLGVLTVAPAVLLIEQHGRAARGGWDHAALAAAVIAMLGIAYLLQLSGWYTGAFLAAAALAGPVIWWVQRGVARVRAALALLVFAIVGASGGLAWLRFGGGETQWFLAATALALLALTALQDRRPDGAVPQREAAENRDGTHSAASAPPFVYLAVFFSAYVLAGGFGQGLAIIPGSTITFWPPSGIFVATLITTPRRHWGWWTATAALAEITCNAVWFHSALPLALLYFGANASEALTFALLLGRLADAPFRFRTAADGFAFVIASLIAPTVGATAIATVDAVIGKHLFLEAWPLVWLGDWSGLLVCAPLTLLAVETWHQRDAISVRQFVEAGVVATALGAVGALAFAGYLPTPYVCLPLLLWCAVRYGVGAASAGLAFLALAGAILAIRSPAADFKQVAVGAQLFFAVSAVSVLIVGGLAAELRQAAERLARANANLERRVAERTASLASSQAAAVDRADEIAAIYKAAPIGLALLDADMNFLRVNEHLARMNGLSVEEHIGRSVRDLLPPLVVSALNEIRSRLLSGEETVETELDLPQWRPGGGHAFVRYRAIRNRDSIHFLGVIEDITERRLAEAALRDSEARLTTILDAVPIGVGLIDRGGRFIQRNPALQKLAVGPVIPSLAEPEKYVGFDTEGRRLGFRDFPGARALRGERAGPADLSTTIDGNQRWIRVSAVPLFADGEVSGAVAVAEDITADRRREDHVRGLMAEINHRAKNVLSVVQAIARQTGVFRTREAAEQYSQRISAFGASFDLLVGNNWKSVEVEELIRAQLQHFGDRRSSHIDLNGPTIRLSAAAAQTLGMALHELGTNACKYGALSTDRGRVEITWRIADGDRGRCFEIAWSEAGGPPARQPSRRGFGSWVTQDMVRSGLGADVDLSYAPTGLKWRLRCRTDRCVDGSSDATESGNELSSGAKKGRSVLVVEDDPLIALDVAASLREAGLAVVGPAASVAEGLHLLSASPCDCAVLDVNLGSETSEVIAQQLAMRGLPYVTISGYGPDHLPASMRAAPFIRKPVEAPSLVAELELVLSPEPH